MDLTKQAFSSKSECPGISPDKNLCNYKRIRNRKLSLLDKILNLLQFITCQICKEEIIDIKKRCLI